jgi:hypothetical protein
MTNGANQLKTNDSRTAQTFDKSHVSLYQTELSDREKSREMQLLHRFNPFCVRSERTKRSKATRKKMIEEKWV